MWYNKDASNVLDIVSEVIRKVIEISMMVGVVLPPCHLKLRTHF